MLCRSEYDERYFDGSQQIYRHNAGYTQYIDRGFEEQAKFLVNELDVSGKILDVGAAKGFLVQHLRNLGIDAFGIDWSEYASGFSKYVQLGEPQDITDHYDFIISARFFLCLHVDDIQTVIDIFNNHSNRQIHFIEEDPNEKYYIRKPLDWWAGHKWAKGTTIIGRSWNNRITI